MKALYLCATFLLAALFCKAQIEIKGKVLDSRTEKPIATASIYLNNTSAGAIADSNGIFVLHTNSLFTGELIVSSVGYKPLSIK